MVILGEPMPSMQSAALTLLVPAGCCYEPFDQAGLASLTCEMMLRGCGPRDSRQFVTDLENLGVERGESVGVSQASYSGATLSDNLPAALEIVADLVRRPHLPASQLDAGRSVCLQELHAVDDEPSHKLMIELRKRQYPDPWGRSSLGDEDTLQAMSIDHVQQFYGQQYRPQGAILAVAGRFDWQAICDKSMELFGNWTGSGETLPLSRGNGQLQTHIIHDSQQCHIGLGFASIPYKHPDYFQAWAAVGVLSGGMSSRLFTEVREKRGLCYSVSASLHSQRGRASVLCYAGTTIERAQETLDVTHAELLRLADGIEQGELDRLKARIKSSLIMQQESTMARSGSIARDWYHLGRVRTLAELGKIIDELSAESINAYLAENPPSDFKVVTLGPAPLELPNGVS
jgi:predicted Zn-dependent peptidase